MVLTAEQNIKTQTAHCKNFLQPSDPQRYEFIISRHPVHDIYYAVMYSECLEREKKGTCSALFYVSGRQKHKVVIMVDGLMDLEFERRDE